jgi:hypothetical protein
MSPGILAKLHFYETSAGGRKAPLIYPWHGCIFEFEGELRECRLLLNDEIPVSPGQTIALPIVLLRPEVVLPKLRIGQTFFLRDGMRRIARGEVVEIQSKVD